MAKANLIAAKTAKKDEFYTQLTDIQSEMSHYSDKFKDQVVLCNCDDPFESNFVKYFLMNFNRLGLKGLIATGYKASYIGGSEIGQKDTPYVLKVYSTMRYLVGTQKDLDIRGAKYFLETEGDKIMSPLIGNYAIDADGNPIKVQQKEKYIDLVTGKEKTRNVEYDLYYDAGDFRSNMSVELLKESDIVVTNPPFSLFREYIAQLIEYKKKFLVIGHQNAITYKEIFPLIKANRLWLGYGFPGNVGFFKSPYEDVATSSQHQEGKIRISGVMWFTNIDHPKRHQKLPLDLGYTYASHEDMYPTYDNYNAINVDKTAQIPCDYCESWGVTDEVFLKLNPCEWERVRIQKFDDNIVLNFVVPAKDTELREILSKHEDGYKEAIEAALTNAIYCSGYIGVPITFLDKYCPEQFEIVKFRKGDDDKDLRLPGTTSMNEASKQASKSLYFRIVVRRQM